MNRLLHDLGYSLQSNRKTVEGRQHPDRDAQFRHVNRHATPKWSLTKDLSHTPCVQGSRKVRAA